MSDGATPPINQPLDASTGRSISSPNWFSNQGYPPRSSTRVVPLVCGEAAFSAVGKALRAAEHSINMAFWGLDPAMLLERGTKDTYDTNHILGEILLKKASEGVKVKVVVWRNIYAASSGGVGSGTQSGYDGGDIIDGEGGSNSTNLFQFMRVAATHPNIDIRLTDPHSATPNFPSYHQKIIMVDVEAPAKATGFVMGHNMMIHYWSTKSLIPNQLRRQFALRITGKKAGAIDRSEIAALEHAIANTEQDIAKLPSLIGNDPRELAYRTQEYQQDIAQKRVEIERLARQYISNDDGSFLNYTTIPAPHLEPYLDVSTQIWGGGVADIYHNFERVWKLNNGTISPAASSLTAASFGHRSSSTTSQAQMGATLAPYGEAAIEDFYFNAISNANRYVLILNQYFRYWDLSDRIIAVWKNRNIPDQKKVPIYVVTNDWNYDWKQQGHDGITKKKFTDARIPISLCKMVTKENIGRKSIYVHAKLLIVDDVFYTIGSANYNYRSLQGDPEFNVAVVDPRQTQGLRREIMNMLIGNPMNDLMQGDPMKPFIETWEKGVAKNTLAHKDGETLENGRVIRYDASRIRYTPNKSVQNTHSPRGRVRVT